MFCIIKGTIVHTGKEQAMLLADWLKKTTDSYKT